MSNGCATRYTGCVDITNDDRVNRLMDPMFIEILLTELEKQAKSRSSHRNTGGCF